MCSTDAVEGDSKSTATPAIWAAHSCGTATANTQWKQGTTGIYVLQAKHFRCLQWRVWELLAPFISENISGVETQHLVKLYCLGRPCSILLKDLPESFGSSHRSRTASSGQFAGSHPFLQTWEGLLEWNRSVFPGEAQLALETVLPDRCWALDATSPGAVRHSYLNPARAMNALPHFLCGTNAGVWDNLCFYCPIFPSPDVNEPLIVCLSNRFYVAFWHQQTCIYGIRPFLWR